MEKLIESTTAYKIFCGDLKCGRLSHAYLLYYTDEINLRAALKLFALRFFETDKSERDGRLIEEGNFTDLKIYPAADKKLAVSDAADIVDDAALKPVERDKKLFVISGFEQASQIFQNKLLKILEEPPEGVYFLLGATSLSPVLDTVKSRVKKLEIPPFSAEQIYEALQRAGENSLNRSAAESCAGILGAAQSIIKSGWYEEVHALAKDICFVKTFEDAANLATKAGDSKYKTQLLTEMQQIYFDQLKMQTLSGDSAGAILSKPACVFALEKMPTAFADVKFNANFSALIYDFAVGVILENRKWKKLSV
jgi:hypothetical protein